MFTLLKNCKQTKARSGCFQSRASSFETPAFFPVATQAAVKGLSSKELDEINNPGLLVNAYHLFLRPGTAVVKHCGGLHKFMNFNRTIITDSGGYQIFSLEELRTVTDQGVKFKSHLDGRTIFLTPENVVDIQLDLGSDIIVPLDECVKYPTNETDALAAVKRTISWAQRSRDYFAGLGVKDRLFFGIIQGSIYPQLRSFCLENIEKIGFDGLCIGGLSVGEPKDLRYNILSLIEQESSVNKLRYFMGYGLPQDILEAVALGVDLFDCVIPTRYARTGTVFTHQGKIVVRNAPYINDLSPLDPDCRCFVCQKYSRAYLRHLINANEMLAAQLLSYHNVFWYNQLMIKIRQALAADNFAEFKREFLANYKDDN